MARRDIAGIFKSAVLGASLVGGLSMTAQADELSLSATTAFTTDYVFRGTSQTNQNPAVQGSLDAAYGIFYAGMWASNVDFGGSGTGQELSTVEIDYYAGIAPEWQGISFDIGGIYYTYPGAYDPGGNYDYFELKTSASYAFNDALTVGVTNYWSPEFFGQSGQANALELAGEYVFNPIINGFFSPSFSALVGWQWNDPDAYGGTNVDYTYWNAGLTLGFMNNFSADIRYWDTDLSDAGCALFNGFADNCDSRVVGTLSASF